MQTKTLLALFCTIVVLLIGANDGAPTTTASVAVKPNLGVPVVDAPTKKLVGVKQWKKKIDPKSKKLFNDYKAIISKKLLTVLKIKLPNPKPDKVGTQLVSGVLYHYLVKTPNKKYAYVTIHSRDWKKEEYGSEAHVTVRPQLYELNDKNI